MHLYLVLTSNNIIANKNILKQEKINQNSLLSATEIGTFDYLVVIFLSHRSNIQLDNLLITTSYSTLISTNKFFTTLNEAPMQLNITNWEIQTSGYIIESFYPTKLYLASTRIDFYANSQGIVLYGFWPSRSIVEDIYYMIDNVTLYYTQDKLAGMVQQVAFGMLGYTNQIITNSKFETYSEIGDLGGLIFTVIDGLVCPYSDLPSFNHLYQNLYITIYNYGNRTVDEASLGMFVETTPFASFNVTLSNITLENIYAGAELMNGLDLRTSINR